MVRVFLFTDQLSQYWSLTINSKSKLPPQVRTSGNMRVVLNTKLWCDMICEKVPVVVFSLCSLIYFPLQANEKNIRISALDDGEVGWAQF